MLKVGELSAAVSELSVVAAIAASHMSMPNHWLPYALMGAGQKWGARRTLLVTLAGALGHVCTTIATVAILSQLGGAVLSHEAYRRFSCAFLLLIGAYYTYTYVVRRERNSCCEKNEDEHPINNNSNSTKWTRSSNNNNNNNENSIQKTGEEPKVDGMAAVSLVAVTSLSPCVGSMPVLLAFLKPPLTAQNVLVAFVVLLTACASVMCSFVALTFIGTKRMEYFSKFRRHERLFLGVSFIALAFLTYFVLTNTSSHHHHTHEHQHLGSSSHTDSLVHSSTRQAHGLGHKGCH